MRAIIAAFALCAFSFLAHAQPVARTVHLIVPYTPATGADILARALGPKLQERWKVAVVTENKPGATGNIGAEFVAKAPADGSTLLVAATSFATNPALNPAPYDPVKSFAPVIVAATSALCVVVNPQVPAQSMKELIDAAKRQPGKLNYGSPGNGTSPHIATEVFNREAKVKLNHIPYKGAGPALQDLIGGQIQIVFDPGVGISPAKAGKVRMIAIAGPNRHPDFPDVPTLEENGIKHVDGGPHFGFYAPAATPREVIAKVNAEVAKAMQHPPVAERFKALAVNVAEPMTPEQFAAYVRGEHAKYAKLIPELGIKGQ